jgi:hypothetical protein
MDNPSCESCQFFKPAFNGTAYGDCRRFPAPIVHQKDYGCGEHRERGEIRLKEPQAQQKARK